MMSATPYRRPRVVAATSITVLAPITTISAATAAITSRQPPRRGLIAASSSASSSWAAATSHRTHRPGSRSRSIRVRRMPKTATYGTSTTMVRASPAAGPTTAPTVSRHAAAIHTAGIPARTTTRRWKPIHPATTAASPSSAARLNTLDPSTTPAPTLAWPRDSAVAAEVISGASAASAATNPSQASEKPARSPSRSSRVTSSQLAARLATTPAQKHADSQHSDILRHGFLSRNEIGVMPRLPASGRPAGSGWSARSDRMSTGQHGADLSGERGRQQPLRGCLGAPNLAGAGGGEARAGWW